VFAVTGDSNERNRPERYASNEFGTPAQAARSTLASIGGRFRPSSHGSLDMPLGIWDRRIILLRERDLTVATRAKREQASTAALSQLSHQGSLCSTPLLEFPVTIMVHVQLTQPS
jgi:hypothetical protein